MVPFKPKTMYLKKNENIAIDVQQVVWFSTFIMHNRTSLPETHDFWEFNYVEKGEVIVISDGQKIQLSSGDVFFNKPGTVHYVITKKDVQAKLFCISFFTTSKIMEVFEGLKFSLNNEQQALIYKMYDEAKRLLVNKASHPESFYAMEYKDNYPLGTYQLLKIYMEIFLISIAREAIKKNEIISYDSKEDLKKLIYNQLIETISQSVYSDLSIDSLCNNFNYSRSYIYDVFKQFSGVSIMKYYNSLKIKEAKKLINEGKYSLTEISEILKFNNSFYFSRVFKKFENITPSEYKKNQVM